MNLAFKRLLPDFQSESGWHTSLQTSASESKMQLELVSQCRCVMLQPQIHLLSRIYNAGASSEGVGSIVR